jgi:tRNA pseudouridine55 synthase
MKNNLNGWIILDKPSGITSAHAVTKVKRLLKPSKIGHAGTLDPLASGILPLALGEATKTVGYMMDGRKAYAFTVVWGQERDTDDVMGQVVSESDKRPTYAEIEAILPQFTGAIQQIPPDYSAIKIGGVRAYDAARSGEALELKAREVRVDSLAVIASVAKQSSSGSPQPEGLAMTEFICHCGKGTYIRSLARDMGRVLGTLGYISVLRRLRVANFDETHAISLETLEEMVHKNSLDFLRPVEAALDDILACDVSHDQAVLLKSGQTFSLPTPLVEEADGTKVLVRCESGLVAIGEVSQGSVKPVRVFNLF